MKALAPLDGLLLTIARCQNQNGLRNCLLICLIAASSLLIHLSSDAQARGRKSGGRNRQAAAAAAARKQQMIKATQQEVAVARQVLGSAESQAGMSQAQVAQAVEKLSGIREAIKTASSDVQEAAKALREIEAEIIAEQGADSDVVRAQTNLDQAKEALLRASAQTDRSGSPPGSDPWPPPRMSRDRLRPFRRRACRACRARGP